MNTLNVLKTEEPTELVNQDMVLNSPLGSGLSKNQAMQLSRCISIFCLRDGESLLEEGHADDALYVVVDGKLEVTKNVAAGEQVTLQMLHSGDMAGELGFIDGLPHSAGLISVGTCTVYSLTRADLESFLETDPHLVYQVMLAITRTVHRILRKMNIQHVEMQNYISRQHGRY